MDQHTIQIKSSLFVNILDDLLTRKVFGKIAGFDYFADEILKVLIGFKKNDLLLVFHQGSLILPKFVKVMSRINQILRVFQQLFKLLLSRYCPLKQPIFHKELKLARVLGDQLTLSEFLILKLGPVGFGISYVFLKQLCTLAKTLIEQHVDRLKEALIHGGVEEMTLDRAHFCKVLNKLLSFDRLVLASWNVSIQWVKNVEGATCFFVEVRQRFQVYALLIFFNLCATVDILLFLLSSANLILLVFK